MSQESPDAARSRLALEELESRIVPDGLDVTPPPNPPPLPPPPPGALSPIMVPSTTTSYQLYGPTVMNLLSAAIDPNPGGQLDYGTISIVTPPTKGQVTVDPTTGEFAYTPNYLLPNGLPQGQQPAPFFPDSFSFTVRDNLGAMSNVASLTFNGTLAPTRGGLLIAHDGGAATLSLRPVTIDVYGNVDTFDGVRIDPGSFALDPAFLPRHGTVTFSPATGLMTYTPDFGYVGYDNFGYSIADTTGFWQSFAGVFVIISPTVARLQADPLGGQMLVVDGTAGNDTILVNPGRRDGDVFVSVNGVTSGPFRPTSRVVVLGYGGDDRIEVADRVRVTAWLVGGVGNDTLAAGGGSGVLLGGAGKDILAAGAGRSVMIGGSGADVLIGGGADILVAGTTRFDSNQPALNAILREWTSSHDYAQRVLNLTGQFNRHTARRLNGDTYLTFATVQDDAAADTVFTGGNATLLFAAPGGPTGDVVIHRSARFDLRDHGRPGGPDLVCGPRRPPEPARGNPRPSVFADRVARFDVYHALRYGYADRISV